MQANQLCNSWKSCTNFLNNRFFKQIWGRIHNRHWICKQATSKVASTKWYPQCSDGRNHRCIMSAPKCTKGRDKFRVKGWLIVTMSSVSFYYAEQIRSPHEATHLLVTQQHLPALIFRTCLHDIYHYKNLKFVSPLESEDATSFILLAECMHGDTTIWSKMVLMVFFLVLNYHLLP